MKKIIIIALCLIVITAAVLTVVFYPREGEIDISGTKIVQYLLSGNGPVDGKNLAVWSDTERRKCHNDNDDICWKYGKDIFVQDEKGNYESKSVPLVYVFEEPVFDDVSCSATWVKNRVDRLPYRVECEICGSNLEIYIVIFSEKKNEVDLCALLDEMYPYIVGDEELQ